mgnify:FL=1
MFKKVIISATEKTSYRQNVPNHEKQTIFWCQWFNVEWKPLRQLVWASGDILLISFTSLTLVKSLCSFSFAFVPEEKGESADPEISEKPLGRSQ